MNKKILTLFITLIMLATFAVSSSAYTTDDIVKAAVTVIYTNEGSYTSVVANDVGAVSLGKIGWHAGRALSLLKTIVNKNKTQAKTILGDKLYNEILTSSDWSSRIFTDDERTIVIKLLGTTESKTAQDALATADITSYITHGQTLGMTDGKALVYFADLENQMGANGAERVAKAAIASAGSPSKVTLDVIYNAAMKDTTAASSPTRRKSTYTYCSSLSIGSSQTSTYKTGKYKVTATSLNVRSGAGTTYATVTSAIPYGTLVTVTEVSGAWGKITYNGKTGWIALAYTSYTGTTTAATTLAPSSSSVRGDTDGNGKVEANDARLALRASAGLTKLTSAQIKLTDIDGDGKVTANDARSILRAAAKIQSL